LARAKVSAPDMMTVLDGDHIPYRIHPDSGQVLVPDSMLGKVRMLLAAKGVTAQLPAGLELMDKNDPLGVSQFVQDVRFRRGLEGELAQSIMTLDAISHARVHLSIAKSTSFVSSDGEKSSASVVVQLKPGRTLEPEAIAAVVNMVAGSVASLAPSRVSLVDQAGNLLSAHIDLADGFDAGTSGNDASKRYADDVKPISRACSARSSAKTTTACRWRPPSTTTASKKPWKNTAPIRKSPAKPCAKSRTATAW
jgi:flagellar M-ring protein FliF